MLAKNMNNITLEEVKKNPNAYDYIEVMSCPGGCVGGGGQPIPSNNSIIDERRKALYTLDDKLSIRKAHLNPVVKEFFEEYLDKLPQEEKASIIHTSFRKREKGE